MTALTASLLSLLLFQPADSADGPCPPGASASGYPPPDGHGWTCVITDEGGAQLRHGWSVDYWPDGTMKRACEYDHDRLHGRCSQWNAGGELTQRGMYEDDQRVGHWWFWSFAEVFSDADGAVARASTEEIAAELGADEGDAPGLAQHVLTAVFDDQLDIRAAAQLCAPGLCVSAATVDGRQVLAVQIHPPEDKVERSASALARASRAAAAAKQLIERARRRRERAEKKAEANYQSKVHGWSGVHLQCVDGSYSPSCTCGSERPGCCSHHGGVAGCPRDYPELPEPDTSPLVPNDFAGGSQ
ncbi:hypothetical protein G6O69_23960 [Pseudenhygromyxa sp. WMMC2535]|uniref:hypothetical protein n=1 Tax=Pseudenhygromyxa sp. WMMC2535 TaxID=2712867 RepID=UPI00155298F0|nr:hypothetical protein [Pseudenhygromyxa sp. WMMC2535]NVB40916.1 hypothetical protein [Pseudenhygromyxa sp. WMMC2535]